MFSAFATAPVPRPPQPTMASWTVSPLAAWTRGMTAPASADAAAIRPEVLRNSRRVVDEDIDWFMRRIVLRRNRDKSTSEVSKSAAIILVAPASLPASSGCRQPAFPISLTCAAFALAPRDLAAQNLRRCSNSREVSHDTDSWSSGILLKMSATQQRDQVADLAKRDSQEALAKARSISDPWFRSQALAWVARYTEDDPVKVACLATKAASECDDEYKRTAVRAWEIAALAEREFVADAKRALREAVKQSKGIMPFASRAEAFTLLLHAAFRIGEEDAKWVADELRNSCGKDSDWRCQRAVRNAAKLVEGEIKPRPFFW